MAAHKIRVLVSVLAVALMLGTCFLPTINTGDESEASAIGVAATSGSSQEEENYNLDDILTYFSKLDLQELITSLGLPDFDIPFELLPNMSMEEFFTAVKQIMSGEKSLREVLEEAGVMYNEQIASYMRGVMEKLLDRAGEAFTDIIKNSMSSSEKITDVISAPRYCYKGQEYRLAGGNEKTGVSEFTFKDTGKLIFVEGSKLILDGNFKLICDDSLKSGQQIELKQGSIISFCGYEHTIIRDITIEMRGTVSSLFSVDFTMGSVNKADFIFSAGISNGGFVKISRMNTFFQFDSCRDSEDEFSIKLHAEMTDTMLNALNISDSEAAIKDISNPKNKVELELVMFDMVGITDLVSKLDIGIDYIGRGDNNNGNALMVDVGFELSEAEAVLAKGNVTANFTQADLLSEIEAFNNKTSKMLPFKGKIDIDMNLGQRALFNEYGLDCCKLDLLANYDVSVNDSDLLIVADVQNASFEMGLASFVLDNDSEDKIPKIVSVEMPLMMMKLVTDNFKISYPIYLFKDNDLSLMDHISAGSEVSGVLYVGERDDVDITWNFEKYENADYRMEFDGTVDVPSSDLKALMLNESYGEPKFKIDLDRLIIETLNGEYSQSGTSDIEIFLPLKSNDVISDTPITLEIDINCSIDLSDLTGSGYINLGGDFGATNAVMGKGIFENSGAMELCIGVELFNYGFKIEFIDDGKYIVNGEINTVVDFNSLEEKDKKVNIFNYDIDYSANKLKKSLRSLDFEGNYAKTEKFWALENPDTQSLSEDIIGTIGYIILENASDKGINSVKSYYLDRLFEIGTNQDGWIEASVRDGADPLTIVIDDGVKSVHGIADVSLVYGDKESDVSVGRMNVDVGFAERYETSILDAIQRMGFGISDLDIHDTVDANTYMTLLIPKLKLEMTDAVSSPVYEISGSGSSDIQLNKIHLKSEIDMPDGIFSKSKKIKVNDDEEITVNDVTGVANVKADAEMTGGTPGEDGYYHIAIDGLDAVLVLDGTLYTNSRAEMFALLSAGSLIKCNTFIYTTKIQETTDILIEDLYLKYSEEGKYLVVELGNNASNRAANRMKITTSNFKIADKKVKYLEFEAVDNFSTIYVTQEDLARMYTGGNLRLDGFSSGTSILTKDVRVGLSMGRGDDTEMRFSDIDMYYSSDDDILFSTDAALVGNDLSIDYEGNENITYITMTKIETKALCNGKIDLSESEKMGIKFKDTEITAGSSSLSEGNYDKDSGMTIDIVVINGNNMFKIFSEGMRLKANLSGYFSDMKSIATMDLQVDFDTKKIDLGLLIKKSELAFNGSNVTVSAVNEPKKLLTTVKFSSTHVKVDYKFNNNEYAEDLRHMVLELDKTSGDAMMTEYELETVALNVKGEYVTLVLTDLAEVYARNVDLRTKDTLKDFELAAGQYTFIGAIMVFPIHVSGDSTIAFEGTSHFAKMMFDNPDNVSGSFYIGGEIPKKYVEEFVLTGGKDINLKIDNDYVVYVKDLKSKDIVISPLKGHSINEHETGVSYTISEEGNAVLTSFIGIVDINCIPNKYKLSIDGKEAVEVTYGDVREILRPTTLKSGYVFAGWNDGFTTYPAATRLSYTMPARDVQLTTEWAKSIQYKDRNSCSDETAVTFDASEFSKKLKDDTEQISIAMKDLTISMDKTFLSEVSPDSDIFISASIVTEIDDELKDRVGNGICIDITVSNGEEVTTFDGRFCVTVAISSEWDSRKVAAYCIDTTHRESMEIIDVFTKNGVQYATFEIEHFSQYVVDDTGSFVENVDNGGDGDDSGNTTNGSSGVGGNMMLYIGIGAAALVVLLGVVVFFAKRH